MKKLNIEEFRKLSPKEQAERYNELSEEDKFLARITSPIKIDKSKENAQK